MTATRVADAVAAKWPKWERWKPSANLNKIRQRDMTRAILAAISDQGGDRG